MTGLTRTSADLDPRRKRILFRAWHRGIREMDLIMGRYVESVIADLGEADLATLETLIEIEDRDLFAWITEDRPVPPEHDTPVFRAMKAFHTHDKPIDL
ncbi:MAG TPA: succinate dehydrogenase assembly factor 2 [Rhabdaerophilum sp.]|nr:succinate dehydrogenase assembly factor 2 [Rhabdaerophilum sp.]